MLLVVDFRLNTGESVSLDQYRASIGGRAPVHVIRKLLNLQGKARDVVVAVLISPAVADRLHLSLSASDLIPSPNPPDQDSTP